MKRRKSSSSAKTSSRCADRKPLRRRSERSKRGSVKSSMTRLCWKISSSGRRNADRFHLGPPEELEDRTLLAPLLRSRQAWRDSLADKGKQPSAAGERIIQSLIERNFATVAELKAELGAVLDENMLKSTLAKLLDDCWIEVVTSSGAGSGDG